MTTRPSLTIAVCLTLLAGAAFADEPAVPSRAERRDLTLPALQLVPSPEGGDAGPQGLTVAANPRWRPGDWPAALAARSNGGAVTAQLPRAGASFTPGDTVVDGPPVGLLLQRALGGSTARVARLDAAYQPGPWTTLSEPGYQVISANLLDDATGRVLWYKPHGDKTHVRLWHTDGAFAKLSSVDFELNAEWVPFAHSQKYAAGLGYIAFRRVAAGAGNNEIFVWHIGWSGSLPDQIVGGTWIPQQGTTWTPTGFTQVGRGGRLMFSAPEAGCPGACRLAYLFWIVNEQVQIMGGAGYEYYDTAMWDGVGGRLGSEWRAAAQADDEVFFVDTSTGAGRLRFFDRLNDIALEKAYTPDAGFQFAGYTRSAVNHHIQDAAQQALLTNLLTRGCNATNLFTRVYSYSPDSPDPAEQEAMLARSECRSIFMEFVPWAEWPNFDYARTGRDLVRALSTGKIQFSFYLPEIVNPDLPPLCEPGGACWDYAAMCYTDAAGNRFSPYGDATCAPDLHKPAYWAYVEHVFNQALDDGITNFIFGPVWFQDLKTWSFADSMGDTGIVTRVRRLRSIAASRGKVVIIGGAYDGLSLESATAFDYVWHITNTLFQKPNPKGYIELIEDRPCHPTSPGPYCPAIPWHYKYYSVVPMVSMQDTGWETNLFSGLGYSAGADAAERARRRACMLQGIFDVNRRPERAGRVGFFPPMVAFQSYGARGIDGWPPVGHDAPDYPVINCYGSVNEFFYTASHNTPHADGCPDEDAINRLLRGEPSGADCTLVTPPPARDAQFVRTEVPPRMIAGQPYAAGMRYRNSGAVFWAQYLPVQPSLRAMTCPAGWACPPQTLQQMMAPADSRTLFAPLIAPTTQGSATFQLQLFDTTTGEWFGPPAPPVAVNVENPRPDYEARFVAQKVPPRMRANGHYTVPVTFQNLGSHAWDDIGPHNGAIRFAVTAGPAWGPFNRVELPMTVAAGETKELLLAVTAPATPGVYLFQLRPIKENAFLFGDWTPSTTITVY